VIKARQKDIQIEDNNMFWTAAPWPQVRAFSGYEVYSEPPGGPEFNYGGVRIGATWNIFDGFATKGRMQATRPTRRGGGFCGARRSVASKSAAYLTFSKLIASGSQANVKLQTES
jgi:hypothetical protein